MGKATGFLDYTRMNTTTRAPLDRLCDWDEFHLPLPKEQRALQGSRCMSCGVPFCQTGMEWEGKTFGCPLHNLIPEWNDMIHAQNPSHALARLLKTNNFPEFTGRVCPALCEQACICGMYGESVTVRENELSIIEDAFAKGLRLRCPPHYSGKQVAVIGSGPAGLAVADRLNHRGHHVTVIERDAVAGGLLTYGIPNMKLPKSVVKRRIDHMNKEGVTFVTNANAADPILAKRLLSDYDAVVLCCGAEEPRTLTVDTTGVDGFYYGTHYLKSAVERAQFGLNPAITTAQGKQVVIIGTGDTASDCVATALRQGAKSVTQLVRRGKGDYTDCQGNLPMDYAQEEAHAALGQDPRQFGVEVASVVTNDAGKLTAVVTTLGDTLPCDLLIAATGFSGCKSDVCAAFGVDAERTVSTQQDGYATNVDGVFTAGDMRRGASLVVWAIAEGRAAAAEVDEYLMGYTNLQ
ncbi:glutamate synthase subunit beta [Bengtsoniella intestinalis]|uniref:glutamate synthase subunit beta n=1 Tax=Bengtsoniella intestinalis TaxID=3073143 RepID=UPI00391F52E3